MDRYICVHGHFYQPPRENPWLEAIELQDSARPFHDWNERITAECYAPNMASRVLDGHGRVLEIVNNYAHVSFNFGPTLLAWMQSNAADVYAGVLAADRESAGRFGGHGSAMAQVYNHVIMPLANARDKRTQVRWGMRDFESRFGRRPEGMWLAETAVDLASLEALAEQGILFTILAPSQAQRVRKLGRGGGWKDVSGGRIDPSRAYLCRLPSGRKIALFFYDGPISRAVAFEGLLSNGELFADRLLTAFDDSRTWPQLAHIATDGESYGHHHAYGDMALAAALRRIERENQAHITNYGEFLERFPPTHEVEIIQETSWSCAHGVERWRGDCGCNSGRAGWHQRWRGPLRDSLDWLRDAITEPFEQIGGSLLRDPWQARDEYISVVLQRSPENIEQFIRAHATSSDPSDTDRRNILRLMEMQRHAMLMYTSCGWFFDEISGLEATQVMQYAARVLQLAQQVLDRNFEPEFVTRIESAAGNLPEHPNGREVFERLVKPAIVSPQTVGAHYAVSSLFESYSEPAQIYCYTVENLHRRLLPAGRARVAIGHARIQSNITLDEGEIGYGVLSLGDHNVSGGVRPFAGEEAYWKMAEEIGEPFQRADIAQTLRAVDRHFGNNTYSLKLLFKDEQRLIIERVLRDSLHEVESELRQIYEHHAALMRFLADLHLPQPRELQLAADFALNTALRGALGEDTLDIERLHSVLRESQSVGIALDQASVKAYSDAVKRLMSDFDAAPDNLDLLRRLAAIAAVASAFPKADFWKAQNIYVRLRDEILPVFRTSAENGDPAAAEWVDRYLELGNALGVAAGAGVSRPVAA
jgi:alpha-amylase/alpha-mannosidase (GH57 family)